MVSEATAQSTEPPPPLASVIALFHLQNVRLHRRYKHVGDRLRLRQLCPRDGRRVEGTEAALREAARLRQIQTASEVRSPLSLDALLSPFKATEIVLV